VGNEREPSRTKQPHRVWFASTVQPPQGHADLVLASASPVTVEQVGELTEDLAAPRQRQALTHDLPVERMGEPNGEPAPGRHDDDDPTRFELLERRQPADLLQVGETDRLAGGEQLDGGAAGLVDQLEMLLDQLPKRRRLGQVTHQFPTLAREGQGAAVECSAHQLGEELQVPPRQALQLVEGPPGGRPVEGALQKNIELVVVQGFDIDTGQVAVALELAQATRRRTSAAHGPDEEEDREAPARGRHSA
jgi:hypothetical protein